MYIYIYIYIHVCTCIYIYIYIYIHMLCVCVYIYIYIYIYCIYIYIHTYIHTHIYTHLTASVAAAQGSKTARRQRSGSHQRSDHDRATPSADKPAGISKRGLVDTGLCIFMAGYFRSMSGWQVLKQSVCNVWDLRMPE